MNTIQAKNFHRRSIRYKDYDYTQPGGYFVTMTTWHRKSLFGDIVNGEMRLNPYGHIVERTCDWLSKQYPYIRVNPYVIMPNHFHCILHIMELDGYSWGGSRPAPTLDGKDRKIKPLGQLVGAFKTVSAKQINLARFTTGVPVWQRDYFEHIIRDQHELDDISTYITSNPQTWTEDQEDIK